MQLLTTLLSVTLAAGTSLLYATLGEVFTERSGVLNLGVEGMMMMGALSAFVVSFYTQSLLLAMLVAMLVGGGRALIHAFLSNGRYLAGMTAVSFEDIIPGFIDRVPIISAFLHQDIMTYALYLIVPIAWFFMFRTKFGLTMRAVGENPRTASAMGIRVSRVRYLATVVGGMFVGLGGAHLTLGYTPGWSENVTGGRGWIVIALVIFAGWNPARAIFGAILFGGINAIQFRLQAAGTVIPGSFLNMTPYIMTIIVLTTMTLLSRKKKGRFSAPAALGKAFAMEDK